MKTKIVIIDHRDSFTFNLVQLFEQAADVQVDVMPYDALCVSEIDCYDGIILSPGPGIPSDYPKSTALIEAFKGKKPLLGICMGLQIISCYFGGALVQLPEVKHGQQGVLYAQKECQLFADFHFPGNVGLYHSWAINPTQIGKQIEVTTVLADGTIMSIQHKEYAIQAVQFHPESYMTSQGELLAKNWLKMNGLS